jgi:acetyl esterase/lipase
VLPVVRGAELMEPPELSDAVQRDDHVVSDDPQVIVRVHRPVDLDAPAPCVFSIHGGGYVIGSYDMDDAKLDRWCQLFGIVGVSVEYRLAPETPSPGPLEDCYDALKWTVDHADEIGVDATRVGITGVSAGGGLCAALALLARDRGEIDVQAQLLDCPMIDDRQTTVSSQLDDLMIWSRVSNTFGWTSYPGALHGGDDVPTTRLRRAPTTCPDSQRPTCASVVPTDSATRTSPTRCGSTGPACTRSCTSIPVPHTASGSSPTRRSRSGTWPIQRTGSGASSSASPEPATPTLGLLGRRSSRDREQANRYCQRR